MTAWDDEYVAKRPDSLEWLPSGESYTVLEPKQAPEIGYDLVSYDAATGMNRTVLVPAARFIPKGSTKPLQAENYQWSADGNYLLLFTNSKKVWRQHTRGDFWVLDLRTPQR